jgi:hypothetical protein
MHASDYGALGRHLVARVHHDACFEYCMYICSVNFSRRDNFTHDEKY